VWFARVCPFWDGTAKKPRAEYLSQWREHMSDEEKSAFRQKVFSLQYPELPPANEGKDAGCAEQKVEAVPAPSVGGEPLLDIDEGYNVKSLLREFRKISESHSSRLAHPQQRCELYGKFVMLFRKGQVEKSEVSSDFLKPLRMSRNKLQEVLRMVQDKGVPLECPAAFRSGRAPNLQLTDREREDFLNYIDYSASCGRALSVQECLRALVFLKLEKDGLLKDDDCTTESALARSKASKLAARLSMLRAPPVVARALDNLQELLLSTSIMPKTDKKIIPSEARRVCCSDEKGFSSRADSAFKAVAGRGSHPTGAAPDISWDHVTLLTFLPLCGEPCIGVIIPTKRAHPDFQTAFPNSKIWANPSGSTTHESFCWMLQEYGKHAREVQKIPVALSEQYSAAGYKRCGLASGSRIDRDMLFVERADELFSAATAKDPAHATPALQVMQQVSPGKSKCQKSGCGQFVQSNWQLCPHCRTPNDKFKQEDFNIHKKGYRSGWRQNPQLQLPPDESLTPKQHAMLNQVDDLYKEMNRRAEKKDSDKATDTGEAAPVPGKACPVKASSAEAPLPEASKSDDEKEYDLNDPEQCIEWMVR
ncbi:unnamed protein product, partial [Durusdinium trenchii]